MFAVSVVSFLTEAGTVSLPWELQHDVLLAAFA